MADTALCLAENIALLRGARSMPISPTRNELRLTTSNHGRQLSIKQEIDLVNSLTYLASYSDNPERVMALCVEERAYQNSLIISVATNTCSVTHLQQGLQGMASVLEKQSRKPEVDFLNDLLSRVIAHGQARMVRRLALKGSPESTTAARLTKLSKHAAKSQRVANDPGVSRRSLLELSNEFTRLTNLYIDRRSQATHASVESLLISLLVVSTRIWEDHRRGIEESSRTIGSKEMESNAKESFLCRISQLAQYIPTARRLLKLAQRFSVLRTVEVCPVSAKPIRLAPSLAKLYPSEAGILRKHIRCAEKRSIDFLAIESLLERRKTDAAKLQMKIKKQIAHHDLQQSFKVHAEIQLLLHYEVRKVVYPPRILMSSKDACFLCDLFIKIHGQFHIPKTHGKVYELWMLPDTQQLSMNEQSRQRWGNTVARFCTAIEELIMKVASEKGNIMADPRESGILSLLSWSTQRSNIAASRARSAFDFTILSLGPSLSSSVATADGKDSSDEVRRGDSTLSPVTPATPAHRIPDMAESDKTDNVPSTQEMETQRVKHTQDLFLLNRIAQIGFTPVIDLQPGTKSSYTFGSSHTSARFHTPKIHIEVSHALAEALAYRGSPSLRCMEIANIRITVTWLSHGVGVCAPQEYEGATVDLKKQWWTMEPPVGVLFSPAGLLFRNGDQMVQVWASREIACDQMENRSQ